MGRTVPYPVDFQLSHVSMDGRGIRTQTNKMQTICLKTLVCVAMSPKD